MLSNRWHVCPADRDAVAIEHPFIDSLCCPVFRNVLEHLLVERQVPTICVNRRFPSSSCRKRRSFATQARRISFSNVKCHLRDASLGHTSATVTPVSACFSAKHDLLLGELRLSRQSGLLTFPIARFSLFYICAVLGRGSKGVKAYELTFDTARLGPVTAK